MVTRNMRPSIWRTMMPSRKKALNTSRPSLPTSKYRKFASLGNGCKPKPLQPDVHLVHFRVIEARLVGHMRLILQGGKRRPLRHAVGIEGRPDSIEVVVISGVVIP